MLRRQYLSALGVGCVLTTAGCLGVSVQSDDGGAQGGTTDGVITARSDRMVRVDFGMDHVSAPRDGSRLITIHSRNRDRNVATVTLLMDGTTLFDGAIQIEDPVETRSAVTFAVNEPGEYDVTVAFDDESESKSIEVTEDELATFTNTRSEFYYEDGLNTRTVDRGSPVESDDGGTQSGTTDGVITVQSDRIVQVDLGMDHASAPRGSRFIAIHSRNRDRNEATVSLLLDGTTLFHDTVRFEDPVATNSALLFAVHEPGEYDVTVTFDDASESKTIEVTEDELTTPSNTHSEFYYEDGINTTTVEREEQS